MMGPPVNSPNIVGGVRVHTVTPPPSLGSTLPGIAEIYYGDRRRWIDIYNANRRGVTRLDRSVGTLGNPALIMPGTKVHIP